MSDTGDPGQYLQSSSAPKKAGQSVSGAWIVMVLAALVAAAVFLVVTQQQSERIEVVALRGNVPTGSPVSVGDMVPAKVNVDDRQLQKLIRYSQRNQYNGWIASYAMEGGELLNKSAIKQPATANGLRSMSIPIKENRAVSGDLSAGDHIDVYDTANAF